MERTDFPEAACGCDACVSMCKRTPCWPTPDEAQAIIDAGLGHRLWTDWWWARTGDINLLAPAAVGKEGGRAPDWAFRGKGRCTFLTEEGKCELHDKGLKPLEGRTAMHYEGPQSYAEQDKLSDDVRKHIVQLWGRVQDRFNFNR